MKEVEIGYKLAKLAHKKGYPVYNNIARSNFYNRRTKNKIYFGRTGNQGAMHLYGAPTQSLLQQWLRKKFGIYIYITTEVNMDRHRLYTFHITREMVFDKKDQPTINASSVTGFPWILMQHIFSRCLCKYTGTLLPAYIATYEETMERALFIAVRIINIDLSKLVLKNRKNAKKR